MSLTLLADVHSWPIPQQIQHTPAFCADESLKNERGAIRWHS